MSGIVAFGDAQKTFLNRRINRSSSHRGLGITTHNPTRRAFCARALWGEAGMAGEAWQGEARRGLAGPGVAWQGEAGMAWLGGAGRGRARRGRAGRV